MNAWSQQVAFYSLKAYKKTKNVPYVCLPDKMSNELMNILWFSDHNLSIFILVDFHSLTAISLMETGMLVFMINGPEMHLKWFRLTFLKNEMCNSANKNVDREPSPYHSCKD